jgi:cellulose synthase/poly-beta-1,6-N-acetylglucosamine synthase-like glycosyltransferase
MESSDAILLNGHRDAWYGVQYNLMLVFDGDGVLRRHSMVEIRSP